MFSAVPSGRSILTPVIRPEVSANKVSTRASVSISTPAVSAAVVRAPINSAPERLGMPYMRILECPGYKNPSIRFKFTLWVCFNQVTVSTDVSTQDLTMTGSASPFVFIIMSDAKISGLSIMPCAF